MADVMETENELPKVQVAKPAKSAYQKRLDVLIRRIKTLQEENGDLKQLLLQCDALLGRYRQELWRVRRNHGG
ncbi:MAG: hypothetical protein DMG96_25105 [Acidobacteria bacterium]|nr:MAG: hypothetical protein DMG96_25105 [Acidobacteriota bacterium]